MHDRPLRAPRGGVHGLWVSLTSEGEGSEPSLVETLLAQGVDVTVACPAGRLCERLQDLGYRPHLLPAWQAASARSAPAPRLWRLPRALNALARALRPQIVVADGLEAAILVGLARTGLPALWYLQHASAKNLVATLARHLAQRAPTGLVAPSQCALAEIRERLGGDVPAAVVHPGTRWPAVAPTLRATLGLSRTIPVVGFVGPLTPGKPALDAVLTARLARARHPELRLVIVGSSGFSAVGLEDHRALTRVVMGDGGRTVLLGARRDVPALLPDMDAVLVPSPGEPFGAVAPQAAGYGVPVLAAQGGALSEIVSSPRRGRLAPRGNVFAQAVALCDVLAQGRIPLEEVFRLRAEFSSVTTAARWADLLGRLAALTVSAEALRTMASRARGRPRALGMPDPWWPGQVAGQLPATSAASDGFGRPDGPRAAGDASGERASGRMGCQTAGVWRPGPCRAGLNGIR